MGGEHYPPCGFRRRTFAISRVERKAHRLKNLELGRRFAPPRFIVFTIVAIIGMAIAIPIVGWSRGAMMAFDAATIVFFVLIYPLLDDTPDEMRRSAAQNDANRVGLLAITAFVSIVVLAAMASELGEQKQPQTMMVMLIIATLALTWLFSSVVYALHYAHIFYGKSDGHDTGGIDFSGTDEPDYWDFLYFATCLSMTFQVSDMEITSGRIRRVVMFHCLAAFVFNLGIVAFTINVLGGS